MRQIRRSKIAKQALLERTRTIYDGVVVELGGEIKVSISGNPPIRCKSLGGAFALGEMVTVRLEGGQAWIKKLEAR